MLKEAEPLDREFLDARRKTLGNEIMDAAIDRKFRFSAWARATLVL